MPRNKVEYLAVLSCPSGLENDREAVRNAIDEVNASLQDETLGVYLKDWRRDVSPGVSSDAQTRINEQIVDSLDLIIGLLHVRVGTPTQRAASGTIEEIERVLARHNRGENVAILVYFKNEKVAPNQIDVGQLAKVHLFREQLAERGVLYAEYQDLAELGQAIRRALPSILRELREKSLSDPNTEPPPSSTSAASEFWTGSGELANADDVEIEDGVLDVELRLSQAIKDATESSQAIAKAMQDLTGQMSAITNDPASSQIAGAPIHDRRQFVDRATASLEQFNIQIEPEVARLTGAARDLPRATTALVAFFGDEAAGSIEDLIQFGAVIQQTRGQLIGQKDVISHFRSSMASTPRMTRALNEARRRAVRLLDGLLAIFDTLDGEFGLTLAEVDKRISDLRKRGEESPQA